MFTAKVENISTLPGGGLGFQPSFFSLCFKYVYFGSFICWGKRVGIAIVSRTETMLL